MRTSQGAFAYITRQGDQAQEYLLQWNPSWKAFNFVGGCVEPSETFRECCVREIAEELAIVEHIGYDVAAVPLAHVEYEAYSESAQQNTAYVFELFETQLSAEAFAQVSSDPQNLWVNPTEIWAGRTTDGRCISRTVAQILDRTRLSQESDSSVS